ncbi:MAG: hypothetical protein LBE13_20965, partial [Bacteroidales bacterium]|nr:hypothetical protein [Bacteroidales bacterium]
QTITPDVPTFEQNQARILALFFSLFISASIIILSFLNWAETAYIKLFSFNPFSLLIFLIKVQNNKMMMSFLGSDVETGMLLLIVLLLVLLSIPFFHIIYLLKLICNSVNSRTWGFGTCTVAIVITAIFNSLFIYAYTENIPVVPTFVPILILILCIGHLFVIPKAYPKTKKSKN